jgi:hypothetical protein
MSKIYLDFLPPNTQFTHRYRKLRKKGISLYTISVPCFGKNISWNEIYNEQRIQWSFQFSFSFHKYTTCILEQVRRFSELAQTTSNSVYWSSTEVGTLVTCSRHDIAEQLFIWRQTITTHSTLTDSVLTITSPMLYM